MNNTPNSRGEESDQDLPQAKEADDIEEFVHDEVQRAIQQALEAKRTSAKHQPPLATVVSGRNASEAEQGDDDSTKEDQHEKVTICGFPKLYFYVFVIVVVAAIAGGIVAATSASSSRENDISSPVLVATEPPSMSPTSKLAGLLYPGRQLDDLRSAQYDAIRWIVEEDSFLVNPTKVTQELLERHALATLYFGLDGRNWKQTTNWLANTSHCEWGDFVICDENDSVISLQLGSLGLQGSLPPEISRLSFLVELNLSNNYLTGGLPTELYDLTMLTIMDLPNSGITGSLDKGIGRLTSLRELHISNNKVDGHIPSEIGMLSKLEIVDLGQNLLSGEIPTHISGWKSAKSINLPINRLTGFPSEFGSLDRLESLGLHENVLNSTIPTELARATNLQWLNVHNASLYGKIPIEFETSFKALTTLVLADNFLSGSIPVGNWEQLIALFLHGNELQGSIPTAIGNLSNLEVLNLGRNNLSGRMPTELGNLPRLKKVYINNLRLITGPIPSTLGQCTEILNLQLNNNTLTSTIPSQLSNIRTLSVLDLSNNKLSGSVPWSLHQRRRHLSEVRLAGNNLTDGLENLFCPASHEALSIVFEADCLSKLVCNCCNSCK